MFSSRDGITHRHAADGVNNLYIWRITANTLNEQWRTAPNLGLNEELNTKNRDTEC